MNLLDKETDVRAKMAQAALVKCLCSTLQDIEVCLGSNSKFNISYDVYFHDLFSN